VPIYKKLILCKRTRRPSALRERGGAKRRRVSSVTKIPQSNILFEKREEVEICEKWWKWTGIEPALAAFVRKECRKT
jgi:hypothetical protein